MNPPPKHAPDSTRLSLGEVGVQLELTPGFASSKLDELLREHDAETLVFLPLRKPRKKPKKKPKPPLSERDLEKRRAKLGDGPWHTGELLCEATEPAPIPAAWRFDLRRFEARLIAEELGLEQYYWACRDSAVEAHEVEMFSSDDAFDLNLMRARSREGMKELLQVLFDFACLGKSARAAGSSLARLGWATALVLGISLVACILSLAGTTWFSLGPGPRLGGVLMHPVLIPALLLAGYLRINANEHAEAVHRPNLRELSREEADTQWVQIAPHMLAVWIILALSVNLLTLCGLLVAGDFTVLTFVEDSTESFLVALWLLTPLTYARDLSSTVGACIEAVITLLVAWFVIAITLACTNLVAGILVTVIISIVPFDLPVWIVGPFQALASIAAELALATLFLGYTWSKAQEHYGRWATRQVA